MPGPSRSAAEFAPNAFAYAFDRRGAFCSVHGSLAAAMASARSSGRHVVVDRQENGAPWPIGAGTHADLRFVFAGGDVTCAGLLVLGEVEAPPFAQVFTGSGNLRVARGDVMLPWLGAPWDGAGDCTPFHQKAEVGVAGTGSVVLPVGGRFRYASGLVTSLPFILGGEIVADATVVTLGADAALGPRARVTRQNGGDVLETEAGRLVAAVDLAARLTALAGRATVLEAGSEATDTRLTGAEDRLTLAEERIADLLARVADLEAP